MTEESARTPCCAPVEVRPRHADCPFCGRWMTASRSTCSVHWVWEPSWVCCYCAWWSPDEIGGACSLEYRRENVRHIR